ncbi:MULTISPECIES: glycosyltransferase family A protein [Chryseobacterium]|uniref:glycosyltransferase family A protein n=1 Tax=Chryseobacterium TaxID=59732 RepID=UPI00293416B7|nr:MULTISPECIES: glycosyltransferase family A protein [Chryseobacterium]
MAECLDSVYNQTLKNIEVILINDGLSKEFSKVKKNNKFRFYFIRQIKINLP